MVDNPSLGLAIANWANSQIGNTVGSGECFDLADQALKNNGCKSASDFGAVTPTANYVWGTAIGLSTVRAGDILQFQNYTITITTTVATNNADGSGDTNTSTSTQMRPHHTAVVESVNSDGTLRTLEQNVDPGGRVVQENNYSVSPPHSSTTTTSGTTTTTVDVSITGTITAYRPQPKGS